MVIKLCFVRIIISSLPYLINGNEDGVLDGDEAADRGEVSDEDENCCNLFNYHTYMEKTPRLRWSPQDTELFYETGCSRYAIWLFSTWCPRRQELNQQITMYKLPYKILYKVVHVKLLAEKVKQDDAISDLSNILGELYGLGYGSRENSSHCYWI